MGERELNRAEVLARLNDGRLDAPTAAKMVGVSERHVFRLLRTFRKGGVSSLAHQHRGKRSHNRISDSQRENVLTKIREDYADLGPTQIERKLLEHHGIKLSRDALRAADPCLADTFGLTRKSPGIARAKELHKPRPSPLPFRRGLYVRGKVDVDIASDKTLSLLVRCGWCPLPDRSPGTRSSRR